MNILLSSTYEDLKNERSAAIGAIERLEHAVRMEEFSASDELSRDECLIRLRDCDSVVLLIGDRYGSIDSKTNYSVTELEYRTAKELGLPVLAFLKVGPDGKWHSSEDDPKKRAAHEAFKRLVDAERTRQTFQTPAELKFEVVAALDLHARRYGRIGMRGSIFQTVDQFFAKYLDTRKIVNHTFPLAGRSKYIEQLRSMPTLKQRVIVLSGAGGMGKTKILQAGLTEVQQLAPVMTICFLGEGYTFTPDHAKELPEGSMIIVVDDAHRVTMGLHDLLAFIQQHSNRMQIILSTRPHGLPRLRQDLSFAGFDYEEILELSELHPMNATDVETLATTIVGDKAGPRLAQLVAVSQDSPLITVIAGQLFVRHQLDPALLTQDNSGAFRQHVLARFRDELVGNVPDELAPSVAQKILNVVATLTPLNPDNERLIIRIAEFLGVAFDEVRSAVDVLERSGVLGRRGGMLRIAPDVLSDHILEEACFTTQGALTGYAQRSIEAFRDLDLRTVLQNMAELDWRVSKGKGTTLLQEVWQDLRESYQTGNDQQRLTFLSLVAPIAYYQPDEAFTFARLAIQTASRSDATIIDGFSEQHKHILAPILRDIALYGQHTREAAALLWLIGRDDNRPLNTTTCHPIRLLQELAAYGRPKPLAYNVMLFDWLSELVRSVDAFQHCHSPLDILPALLEREGTESWSQGRSFILSAFLVDPSNTAALRRRVLTLLRTLVQQNDMSVRHSIIRTLINVIFRGIIGLGNFLPTSEHFGLWQDEDRLILSMLADFLETEANPVILVEVEDNLITIKHDPRHVAITDDVARLIDQLPLTLESTMIRYLRQGRIQRRLIANRRGATVDIEALDAAIETELHATLEDFFATYSTPDGVWLELERLLGFIADAGVQAIDSDFLLQQMCHRSPKIMLGVADLLVTHPGSRGLDCLPRLLAHLREEDLQHVLACLHAAEGSFSSTVRSMAVCAIAAPKAPANQEEQNMIRRFALDADRPTALVGILALNRFPSEREADVVAILEQISVGDDGEIADRICLLFSTQNGIDPRHLPKPFVYRFLDQLVTLADWSRLSHVSDFIDWVTVAEPERAAAYYLARIAHQRVANFSGYIAIPYQLYGRPTQESAAGGITDSGARAQALRMVRDVLLSSGNAAEIWEVKQICSRLSLSDVTLVLDVLREWIDSNDPQRIINAARLLPHGDSDFVFVHEEYIIHLLEMAHQQDATVFQQVQGAIIDSTQFSLSDGWGVVPHPENAARLSQATEATQRYPQGHVAHAFYQRLMNIALEIRERNNRLAAMLEDE